jgi:hypothetical protein
MHKALPPMNSEALVFARTKERRYDWWRLETYGDVADIIRTY